MKQFLSHSEGPAGRVHGRNARMAWSAGIGIALGASALACSEASPPTSPYSTAGTGGQVATAGSGGSGVVAGTSSTPTAGTASGTSGAAGTAGTSGGGSGSGGTGGAGGRSSGGAGGAGGTAGGSAGSGGGSGGGEAGWVPLFNGTNLDGWTPSQGHGALFAAGKLNEEPVIHVYPNATTQPNGSSQPEATLRTTKSYSKYVFHLEYKWGTRRFGARTTTARDNGICFHICNEPSKVWPDSVEFQLGSQEWGNDWVSGNIFMLINKTRAKWTSATLNGKDAFSETGAKKSIGAPTSYYRGLASAQLDKPDDWNIIELTVNGATDAEYKVNGTVVNRVFEMECDEGSGFKPLDKGPIALQAEYAETYFRNIKIKELP